MKRLLIIVSTHSFGELLLDMVKNHCNEEMEVRSLIPIHEDDIWNEISDFHPDIVVVDETGPKFVFDAAMFLSLRFKNIRLVIICADSNEIQIYDKQHIELAHIDDLLGAL